MTKEEALELLLSGIKVEYVQDPKYPKGGQIAGWSPMICIITHPEVDLKIEIGQELRSRHKTEQLGKILFELAIKEIHKL